MTTAPQFRTVCSSRKVSDPSVISIVRSAAMLRNVCRERLAGQVIVTAATDVASDSPISSTRLLPP